MGKHKTGQGGPPTTYEVGYGKPPVATRFKPGQSGNPNGRPRGAKAKAPRLNEERLKDIVIAEAYRHVPIRDGEKTVTVPMAQAIVRSLAVSAAKGNPRAQRLFAEMLSTTERQNRELHDQWLNTAMDYKIGWTKVLEDCRRNGREEPTLLPHPDDIVIDMSTGGVQILGPMTPEEVPRWERLRAMKQSLIAEQEELTDLLIREPDYKHRGQVEKDIRDTERMLDQVRQVVPDR